MQPVIHPPWHFASCALHISCISTVTVYSQSYSFPNFETIHCSMSSSNSISWPAYKFLRRQIRWPGIPISSRIFHKFLWSTQSKTFHSQWSRTRCILEIHPPSFFFDYPVDVGNLFSGFSAFSKSSLYIWKFSVHILLKTILKDFLHYLASIWSEHNCTKVWTFFLLPFFEIAIKSNVSQLCGHCWVVQTCWHIECSMLAASLFRLWNSSAVIPSPPIVLFVGFLRSAWLKFQDVWL